MKESLWGYYLVLLGVTVSTVMIMMSNMTTTNQQNYYLLKEVTHAAMNDAIDFSYYREYGKMKINKEKFVENFLRRFSEGISKSNTYKIDFYSITENPPSASIKVTSNTGNYTISGDTTNVDVVNTIDVILESNNVITKEQEFTASPYGWCDESRYITKDKNSPDYGYCRIMVKTKLNFDESENSPFIKELKEKLSNQAPNLKFDKSKIKVLSTEYLYPTSSVVSGNIFPVGEKILTWDDLHSYSGSIYAIYAGLADVTGVGADETGSHYAENIKNVKLSVVQDKDTKDFYVAYGADFNCMDQNGENDISFKTYRNKNYYLRNDDTNINNALSSDDFAKIVKNNPEEEKNYYIKLNHISENTYNGLSATEKEKYEKAPYYGNCVVSFKYFVDFYYDLS